MLGSMSAAAFLQMLAGRDVLAADRQDHREQLSGLACNIDTWWLDVPFLERFRLAAEHGFTAVEFWSPVEEGRDMDAVAVHCRDWGLGVVQFTGWFGPSLADRGNHDAFAATMRLAVDLAHQLHAPMFTVVGHEQVDGIGQADSVGNITAALESVVPILEDAGKTLILEPFNPVDHAGFFLNGSADALDICRRIDSPFVKINWDLYHMQLTEGNLIANMRAGIDQIGYVQVADVPGRHQPGTGELNYAFIFNAIRELGYAGPIGLECWPDARGEQAAIADLLAVYD